MLYNFVPALAIAVVDVEVEDTAPRWLALKR